MSGQPKDWGDEALHFILQPIYLFISTNHQGRPDYVIDHKSSKAARRKATRSEVNAYLDSKQAKKKTKAGPAKPAAAVDSYPKSKQGEASRAKPAADLDSAFQSDNQKISLVINFAFLLLMSSAH